MSGERSRENRKDRHSYKKLQIRFNMKRKEDVEMASIPDILALGPS